MIRSRRTIVVLATLVLAAVWAKLGRGSAPFGLYVSCVYIALVWFLPIALVFAMLGAFRLPLFLAVMLLCLTPFGAALILDELDWKAAVKSSDTTLRQIIDYQQKHGRYPNGVKDLGTPLPMPPLIKIQYASDGKKFQLSVSQEHPLGSLASRLHGYNSECDDYQLFCVARGQTSPVQGGITNTGS